MSDTSTHRNDARAMRPKSRASSFGHICVKSRSLEDWNGFAPDCSAWNSSIAEPFLVRSVWTVLLSAFLTPAGCAR